jgi:DNA invertase Pin-like site-specific DNA recombinase
MNIGYCRVSTDDQRLDLQLDAMARAQVDSDRIYSDIMSGAKSNRPGLKDMLRQLREGDVVIVWRLDRLARSLLDLLRISQEIEAAGAGLRSLSESIDTTTAGGRMIFHVLGALAEFERNLIRERTKAGMQAARERGAKIGGVVKMDAAKLEAARTLLADTDMPIRAILDQLKVSKGTLFRHFPGGRSGLLS